MPGINREPGFLLSFDDQEGPCPRYLGRVNADVSVEELEEKIPAPDFKVGLLNLRIATLTSMGHMTCLENCQLQGQCPVFQC